MSHSSRKQKTVCDGNKYGDNIRQAPFPCSQCNVIVMIESQDNSDLMSSH